MKFGLSSSNAKGPLNGAPTLQYTKQKTEVLLYKISFSFNVYIKSLYETSLYTL